MHKFVGHLYFVLCHLITNWQSNIGRRRRKKMGRGFRKRLGGEAIASEDTDTFSIFGPFHLTSIDW